MSPRRRWLYTQNGEPLPEPVEVTADFTGNAPRPPAATEGITYDGLRHSDGTPLDSRRKHREFLNRTGLALASDFKEAGPAATKAREDRIKGHVQTRQLHEAVERAAHDVYKKRRR